MTDEPQLPVDSFRDAAPFLRRPFTPAAVKFKVQATWPTGALIVAYIDARLTVERLNLIVPHLWSDQYTALGGKQMWCHLTVDGITRHDVGEGDGKGLVSDALKRAAVKFGVGVSLYAIPKMTLNNDMLKRKQRGQKEEVTLTDAGERRVRSLYETWLKDHGIAAFGEPLNHGDVEGAQGDAEAEAPVSEPSVPPKAEPPVSDVPAPDLWYDATVERMKALKMTNAMIREMLEEIGTPIPEHVSSYLRLVRDLNDSRRGMVDVWLLERESVGTPLEPVA